MRPIRTITKKSRGVVFVALVVLLGLASHNTAFANNATVNTLRWEDGLGKSIINGCHHDLVGKAGYSVQGRVELEKMCSYLADSYSGMDYASGFKDQGKDVYCVEIASQTSVRALLAQGIAVELTPPAHADDSAPPAPVEKSCPTGLVPYVLKTIEQLARFPTLEAYLASETLPVPETKKTASALNTSAYNYDIVSAVGAQNKDVFSNTGVDAYINVWKPYTTGYDKSFALVAASSDAESVGAGWAAYRIQGYTYPPHAPVELKLHAASGALGSCGGFVQTNSAYYPGMPLVYSSAGGTQYAYRFTVVREMTGGLNWWVKIYSSAIGTQYIGYYPKECFSSMRTYAANAFFLGEVSDYEPADLAFTESDMGSGALPSAGFGYAAYMRNIQYIDTKGVYIPFQTSSTSASKQLIKYSAWWEVGGDPNLSGPVPTACYDATLTASTGSWGTYMYFGGPGYSSTCQKY